FRWSRNPIYVGMALIQAGVGIALGNLWILLLLAPTLVILQRAVVRKGGGVPEGKVGGPPPRLLPLGAALALSRPVEAESEQAARRPAPALRPYVARYTGWRLRGLEPATLQALPSRYVTWIASLGAPVRVPQHAG